MQSKTIWRNQTETCLENEYDTIKEARLVYDTVAELHMELGVGLKVWGGGCGALDLFHERPGSSHIWRGIVWGSHVLKRGVRWVVVNGRSTRFWLDVWVNM